MAEFSFWWAPSCLFTVSWRLPSAGSLYRQSTAWQLASAFPQRILLQNGCYCLMWYNYVPCHFCLIHKSHLQSREEDFTSMDNKRWCLWGLFWSLARNMTSFYHFFPLWVFVYLTWGHSSFFLSLPSDQHGEVNTLVAFLQLFSSVETPGRGSRRLSLGKKLSCFGGSPVTARVLCVWCDSWQVFLSHDAANIMR